MIIIYPSEIDTFKMEVVKLPTNGEHIAISDMDPTCRVCGELDFRDFDSENSVSSKTTEITAEYMHTDL